MFFGGTEINFLGFKISEGKVEPGEKTEAIEYISVPKNVQEVPRFLGLAGYYRLLIVKYAEEAAPLTKLTKKEQGFCWKIEQQKAFSKLKSMLCEKPVLMMLVRMQMPKDCLDCYCREKMKSIYTWCTL